MKIAVLADTHLRQDAKERFEVLSSVLDELREEQINTVVVAGDFCDEAPFPDMEIYIVIGNHDLIGARFDGKYVGLDNVIVVNEPMLLPRTKSVLLLPYEERKTMSSKLFDVFENFALKKNDWILISHGDLMYGNQFYDDEGYFPITPVDLRFFAPKLVVLGHIHSAPEFPDLNTFYCGSLCAISSNEYGLRRFFIIDEEKGVFERRIVQYGKIYWKDEVLVLDDDDFDAQMNLFWERVSRNFAGRKNWQSDLNLFLTVSIIKADKEDIVNKLNLFFQEKSILSVSLDVVAMDVPNRYVDLMDMFVKEVHLLCSGETEDNFVKWGGLEKDIIKAGIESLRKKIIKL